MPREVIRIEVKDGEVVSPGAEWVYAWCEDGVGRASVVYVGATTLHPAARAEKHLRDPDPRIGRVRARYAGSPAPLSIRALELDPGCRRALVKAGTLRLAHRSGLLSPHYFGEPPALPGEPLSAAEEACVRSLVASFP